MCNPLPTPKGPRPHSVAEAAGIYALGSLESEEFLAVADLVHGEAQFGHSIFKGLAPVVIEPFFGTRNSLSFFLGYILVFDRWVGQNAGTGSGSIVWSKLRTARSWAGGSRSK